MEHKRAAPLTKSWVCKGYDYTLSQLSYALNKEPLKTLLADTGYTSSQKSFTTRQMITIYSHLGPFIDDTIQAELVSLLGNHLK